MNASVRTVSALFVAMSALVANAHGQIFAIVSDTSELYKISQVDGSVELVGDAGEVFLVGLDYRASDGYLYGFNARDLVRVDPRNANAIVVGPHGLNSLTEGGLAIAPNDIAYGLNKRSTSSLGLELFSINLDTGQGAVIANLGNPGQDVNGLAWRSDGKLVGIDRSLNALITIDPATADNEVVSFLVPSLGGLGGLAGHGRHGFFTTAPPLFEGTNEIYSIDFFTGEHSLVGSLGPTFEVSGISGLAFIPEPDARWLAATTLVACVIGVRVRF